MQTQFRQIETAIDLFDEELLETQARSCHSLARHPSEALHIDLRRAQSASVEELLKEFGGLQ